MKKKIALITGGSGQDGSYLAKLLLSKNYRVVIADRRSSRSDNWRHKFLSIEDKVIYEDFDLLDNESISRIFKKYVFNEVYNLAAQSSPLASFNDSTGTLMANGVGAARIFEIAKNYFIKRKNQK